MMKMIEQDLQQIKRAIQIKIYADRMELINPSKSIHLIEHAIQPYSHPRMLIANMEAAESTLQKLVAQSQKSKFLKNIAFAQAMERAEYGITDIEIRVIREAIYNAGFAEVRVYDDAGNALNKESLPEQISSRHYLIFLLAMILVLCGIAVSYIIYYTA